MPDEKMKAVHYEGPFKVSVKEVELPKIQHPDDVIVKVTTAAICGSDLHMYQGRTAAESGLVFGHENMGVVIETGSGVTLLEKGDRIVLPFNVVSELLYFTNLTSTKTVVSNIGRRQMSKLRRRPHSILYRVGMLLKALRGRS